MQRNDLISINIKQRIISLEKKFRKNCKIRELHSCDIRHATENGFDLARNQIGLIEYEIKKPFKNTT